MYTNNAHCTHYHIYHSTKKNMNRMSSTDAR